MATTLRHPFPSCVSIYLFVIVGWGDLLITFPTFPPFVYTSHYTMLILTSSGYYDYATYHAYPFLTLNNLIYHSRLHFYFILLLPHISHQYLFQHSIHWFYIFYGILFLIWLSVYLTNQNWWMQVLAPIRSWIQLTPLACSDMILTVSCSTGVLMSRKVLFCCIDLVIPFCT